MANVQGNALVASPYLMDPNFLRSVVYILRHDQEGAIGLVLNRPTQTSIGSLLEQLTDSPVSNDSPVYYGGPVDGPLMMLFQAVDHGEGGEGSDQGESKVVSVASDQELIVDICVHGGPERIENYRVFDGYSGWGANQLDCELEHGGWLVWDIQPEQVFAEPDELWQLVIRQIGREILSGGIDPSKIPEDPAFN